jgi:hypothetical protein
MVLKNRNCEAVFRIFAQDDSSYAIEVVVPESSPTTVSSFPTQDAAEKWIVGYKARVEADDGRGRRTFHGRPRRAAPAATG